MIDTHSCDNCLGIQPESCLFNPNRHSRRKRPSTEEVAHAALLAFRYIGDRSAGSGEAWEALARALGVDTEDATASEMLGLLEDLAKETA